VPVTTGPQDPAAAGGGRLRTGHADREQVIGTLQDAFVRGRLTMDEFDVRVGRALTARTYDDLAALTADLPHGQAARPDPSPAPARDRPLARATAELVGCLLVATAAWWAAGLADPGATPTPYDSFALPLVLVALFTALAGLCIFGSGVAAAWERRRSRRSASPQ
jgi:hypothetical protein